MIRGFLCLSQVALLVYLDINILYIQGRYFIDLNLLHYSVLGLLLDMTSLSILDLGTVVGSRKDRDNSRASWLYTCAYDDFGTLPFGFIVI